MRPSSIRRAQSRAADARQAVREFHAAVAQPDTALVLFFCSSDHDLHAVAEEMRSCFGDLPVLGCTTAGEIGPAGYLRRSLSGLSLGARDFAVANGRVEDLAALRLVDGQRLTRRLVNRLGEQVPRVDAGNTFGLLLIDGLSGREEPVAHALQCGLGHIPLIGGSAGDDLHFQRSQVYADGAFRSGCAQLVLVSTALPFRVFKSQHFSPGEQRMVVTSADPALRLVHEIDGLPAGARYAQLLGLDPATLGPGSFAEWPVAVMMGGGSYVRAIRSHNPDGSLSFFSAIDEGLVLRAAHGECTLENLARSFESLRRDLGELQLTLACDCILRTLELERAGRKEEAADFLRRQRAVGFSSYGEQYLGVHVNQTLTGVAIGTPAH